MYNSIIYGTLLARINSIKNLRYRVVLFEFNGQSFHIFFKSLSLVSVHVKNYEYRFSFSIQCEFPKVSSKVYKIKICGLNYIKMSSLRNTGVFPALETSDSSNSHQNSEGDSGKS